MIPISKKTKQLKRIEARAKYQLNNGLLSVLQKYDTPTQLAAGLDQVSLQVQRKIVASRQAAEKLADAHSETSKAVKKVRQLLIAAAALNLVRSVASAVALSSSSYSVAIQQAVQQNNPLINRLASTEVFQAYNEKFIANWRGKAGSYRWEAVLDKRVCPVCAKLDGKTWKSDSQVPPPPHPNCRCFLSFIKD